MEGQPVNNDNKDNVDFESEPNEETLSEFRESHKDNRIEETQQKQDVPKVTTTTAEAKQTGWWFWTASAPIEYNTVASNGSLPSVSPVNTDEPVPTLTPTEHQEQEVAASTIPSETAPVQVQADRRESWADWINPAPRVNQVVSYIYSPQQVGLASHEQQNSIISNQLSEIVNSNDIPTPTISRAASENNSFINQHDNNSTLVSWFLPWTYFQSTQASNDRADSTYSNTDSEIIARDARKAIASNSSENRNSSWAFHSSRSETYGELAVAGTGSEFHPARMSAPPTTFYENQERSLKPPAQPLVSSKSLVIPEFNQYHRVSTLKNRTRIALSSSKILRQTFNLKPQTHLYCSEHPKIIKKAVVIGIHGYFPIKMVRSLIGHPTGTSVKYANKAAKVLSKWASDNKMELEIETIALEGEGKIIERVEKLIGLLENWHETLKSCDFIYVASHSQGVMVAIHLVAELILRNKVSTKSTAIGMLNMCGVCAGPIVGLDSKLIVKAYSKFENEILMELFDFQDLTSYQSVKLLQSMRTLVAHNVKLTLVGSLNDQLCPLYSSLFTLVNHPNISRAVFVDKNTNEEIPDFLIKLVKSCVISQNMGYSDYDLLIELSRYAGGSLTNGGHSKVYNDEQVYLLGIKNTLETDSLYAGSHSVLKVSDRAFSAKNINKNPYHLPWCLRGFIDELVTIKNIDGNKLKQELLESYDNWNPQTKLHKELKYCVEVIGQKY